VKKVRLYFDTSTLIKEFRNEIGSDLISKLTSTDRYDLQIISSIWTINEIIGIIDRLSRTINEQTKRPELTNPDIQQIISTLVERIKTTNENSFYRFVYLDHPIITDSRTLITDFHLSPNNAVHVFTGFVYDCDYFLVQNKKLIKQFSSKQYLTMRLIDLTDDDDRKFLENKLNL
jgi:hypothetical protein